MIVPRNTTARKVQGFTLFEILIAIALIAMLAGLLITNLDRILGGGKEEVARVFVRETMVTPLMSYRINVGRYPTTEEGLQALLRKPNEEATNWNGPYIKSLPKDPWGSDYQYRSPGQHNPDGYDLWSYGSTGAEGGTPIGNWIQQDSDH